MNKLKFRAFHMGRLEMYNVHGWHSEYCFKDTLDGIGNPGNPDKMEDVVLMQFTGLKDKNGKDIYEGDIVNVDRTEGYWTAVIQWNNQSAGFYIKNGKYYRDILSCTQHWTEDDANVIFLDNVEVIGNIYENTNILK